jgi:hypothetical protein
MNQTSDYPPSLASICGGCPGKILPEIGPIRRLAASFDSPKDANYWRIPRKIQTAEPTAFRCAANIQALGRKNYLFMGSDSGGKSAAVLYSIMASAKANQVEPFTYVRDLLSQLLGCSPPAVAMLLPDVRLAAHPESRRCWSR